MELNTIVLYITIIVGLYNILSGFSSAEKTFLRFSASYSKHKEKIKRFAWGVFAIGIGYLIFAYVPNSIEKIIPISDIRGAELYKCVPAYCARIVTGAVGILKIQNDPNTPYSSLTFHFEPASSFEGNWNGQPVRIMNGQLQINNLIETNTLVIEPEQNEVIIQKIRVDAKTNDDKILYIILGLAVLAYGILMLFNRHDKTLNAIYGDRYTARKMLENEIKKYVNNNDENDRKMLVQEALKVLKRKFDRHEISKDLYLTIRTQTDELLKKSIADFNKEIYK